MQGDLVHFTSPYQQGFRGVRSALVTVAATFNNEPQIVVPGEVDGGHNVLGASAGDRIGAWCGSPAIEPTGGLRPARLFPDKVWVLHQRSANARLTRKTFSNNVLAALLTAADSAVELKTRSFLSILIRIARKF
jgi:hypothetical protein